MLPYEIQPFGNRTEGNTYPGRGIVLGQSPDGKSAIAAYFIMGRSENSRNRIFAEEGADLRTMPFDPSKVEDPSLIIYYPVRTWENRLIVTNGDQTDTIYHGFQIGKTFSEALESRTFEPDGPNWTPRISGCITFEEASFTYAMSILKSGDAEGTVCNRFTFDYAPLPGVGHFLHTYAHDGNPIPTFAGEPERVAMVDDIDDLTEQIWNGLDEDNRISLYVRYTDLATRTVQTRLINKHSKL